MAEDVLPESRAREVRGVVRSAKFGNLIPIFCANCGKQWGMVPEHHVTFAFALCDDCEGKHGGVAHLHKEPDAVFWERIANEQREQGVTASGRISSVITTPGTARFDIRMGAAGNTVVFDSLAILLDTVAAHTTVGWYLEILMTCRAIGTAANFMGQGKWTCEDILGTPAAAPKGSLTAILPWNAAPAVGGNFDSTVTNIVDMFFTQTVATGSMTLHQYSAVACN
jgi:hypothetical protein